MLKIIYISLIILVTLALNLQAENPDSLKAKASKLFHAERYVESIDTLNRAIELFSQRRDEYGLSCCYNNLGLYLWKLGDTSNAMKYFIKARNYAQNVSLEMVSFVNTNIGHSYMDIGDYTDALFYYNLVKYENENTKSNYYYFSKISCANVYIQLNNYKEAFNQILDPFNYFKKNQNKKYQIMTENYLANILIELNSDSDTLKNLLNKFQISNNFFTQKYLAKYYQKTSHYYESINILKHLLNDKIDFKYRKDLVIMLADNYKFIKNYDSALNVLEFYMKNINKYDLVTQRDYLMKMILINQLNHKNDRIYLLKCSLDSINNLIIIGLNHSNLQLSQALLIAKYQISSLKKSNEIIEQKIFDQKLIIILLSIILICVIAIILLFRMLIKQRVLRKAIRLSSNFNYFNI